MVFTLSGKGSMNSDLVKSEYPQYIDNKNSEYFFLIVWIVKIYLGSQKYEVNTYIYGI